MSPLNNIFPNNNANLLGVELSEDGEGDDTEGDHGDLIPGADEC